MCAALVGKATSGQLRKALARFFSGWIGWIAAMLLLNLVPRIAMSVRDNPQLGVPALLLDGFVSGIAISPLLWVARTLAPNMIFAALGITAFVFVGITLYVMTTSREFSAPRGLMTGIFFSIIGAVILKQLPANWDFLGVLIAFGIPDDEVGVFTLVYATSSCDSAALCDASSAPSPAHSCNPLRCFQHLRSGIEYSLTRLWRRRRRN